MSMNIWKGYDQSGVGGAPATTLDDAEEEEKEAVVVNEPQPDF